MTPIASRETTSCTCAMSPAPGSLFTPFGALYCMHDSDFNIVHAFKVG